MFMLRLARKKRKKTSPCYTSVCPSEYVCVCVCLFARKWSKISVWNRRSAQDCVSVRVCKLRLTSNMSFSINTGILTPHP